MRLEVDVYKLMSEIVWLGEVEEDKKVETYDKIVVKLMLVFLNSRARFLMSPILSGALDFEHNAAYDLCMFFKNKSSIWLVSQS